MFLSQFCTTNSNRLWLCCKGIKIALAFAARFVVTNFLRFLRPFRSHLCGKDTQSDMTLLWLLWLHVLRNHSFAEIRIPIFPGPVRPVLSKLPEGWCTQEECDHSTYRWLVGIQGAENPQDLWHVLWAQSTLGATAATASVPGPGF